MTPGATYHGEVCTYVETWSAPENDARALLDYQTMFQEYLFNITNTTLFNFSIAASTTSAFALRRDLLHPSRAEEVAAMAAELAAAMHAQGAGAGRRLSGAGVEPIYPAKTPEPGQSVEDIDYWERGRRVINRDVFGHDRKTGIRTDPPAEHGPTMVPLSFPPPLQRPVDWRNEFDFAKLYEKRLVDNPFNATWAQHHYRAMDCAGRPETPAAAAAAAARRKLDNVPAHFEAYPTTLFTITSEFLMSSERAREGVLTLTTWHAMRDLLAPFEMVPSRDRSFECRSILEFDPAPSPPPPNDWIVPPSPPVFGYEVGVATVGMFGSGLYLLIACMCCCVFGNKQSRARHTSRWPMPTRWWRVEHPIYAEEEARRQGNELNYKGIAGGHYPLPSRGMLDSQPPGGTFGAGGSATRSSCGGSEGDFAARLAQSMLEGERSASGLTFATLVGGSPRSQKRPHQRI